MPGSKSIIEKDGERKRQNDCRYVVRVQHYVIDGCQVDNDLLCQLGLESFDSSRCVIDLVVDRKRLRNIVPNLAWAELKMVNGQLDWTNRQRRRRADWLALQDESRPIQKDRRTNLKSMLATAPGSSKGVNKSTK
jgi:hypothetical protein